jgi:hypothetical protein
VRALAHADGALEPLEQLRRGGRVWSRFQRVLNLESGDGRLLSLHAANVPPTPFSLVLEARPEAPWPEPDTAAHLHGDVLRVGGLRVDLSKVRPMRAIAVPRLDRARGVLPAVAALGPLAADGAFGAWWDEKPSLRHTLPAAMRASAREALADLVGNIRAPRSRVLNVVSAAEKLIGLGPGGTPSGDDALIGFVGAWLRLGPGPAPASDVAAALARRAHGSTTRLAVEFYHHLAHGRLSRPLDDLLRAVALQDMTLLASSTDRLAQNGATSGRDTIAGVHAYLLTRLNANAKLK